MVPFWERYDDGIVGMHAYIQGNQRVKRAPYFMMKLGHIIRCNFFNNERILII